MDMELRRALARLATGVALGTGALACHAADPQEPFRVAQAQAQVNSASEPRLRTAIAYLASGSPDWSDMEPMLHIAVEQQMSMISARLQTLGQLKKLEFVGPQAGSDVYRATFENGVTSWAIQISPTGKLSGLFFQ